MQILDHLKASPILGLLYFSSGIEAVAIAVVASIAIDFDHLHLIIREKAYSYKKIVALGNTIYDQDMVRRCFVDVTYILHSLEINLFLTILGIYYYPPLIYVVIGFCYHIIYDIIHHYRHHLPIFTWLLLSSYFIRLARKHFLTKKEL